MRHSLQVLCSRVGTCSAVRFGDARSMIQRGRESNPAKYAPAYGRSGYLASVKGIVNVEASLWLV